MLHRRPGLLTIGAAALLIGGCRPSPPSRLHPEAVEQPADVVPFADYHTHLWSARVAAHRIKPPLPAVTLPADLAALLRRRETLSGGRDAFRDRRALVPLYTEGTVALHRDFGNWVRGPIDASIQASLHATLTFSGDPVRMTPVAYGASDSVGYIAGYYTRGEGPAATHVGEFHLSLRKVRGGEWRIATESGAFRPPARPAASLPEQLIREMDAAGVRKSLVLASSYWWGSSILDVADDEHARVREENDWVAEQVARYPDRLVGFCGVNPLRDYALEEIARCARQPHLRGIKLHIADSNVDLDDPAHVAVLRRCFEAANRLRLPIAAHVANQDLSFGRRHVGIYLDRIFPAAPDITIQLAHLAGHGPSHGGEALAAFTEAAGDPRMRNVYFDVASNVMRDMPAQYLAQIATHLRRIGLDRILFATDWPAGGAASTPKEAWAAFRRLPLTLDELRNVADNVMPYMR